MIYTYTPKCIEDFETLKKGDLILVEWDDYFVKHTPKTQKVMAYKIFEVYPEGGEIICKKKNNVYFNYTGYLVGKSHAKRVLIVS